MSNELATEVQPQTVRPSAPSPASPEAFRAIFGAFPTGVTIVTCIDSADRPVGMTVSAVSALSLDPPQLLICLQHGKYTLDAIRTSGTFGVNFLSETQADLSGRFASSRFDKFTDVSWSRGETLGVPGFDGALAVAECRVSEIITSGDHDIVIGTLASGTSTAGNALVYWNRGYHSLLPVTV